MFKNLKKQLSILLLNISLAITSFAGYQQDVSALLHGQTMAIAYSGYREGQHPDRGHGAKNPSEKQVLEDLSILTKNGFKLIRVYDSGSLNKKVLRLIEQHQLPIKVVLGIWLQAEVSNHEGCSWCSTPIPESELKRNTLVNRAEVQRGIDLANQFPNTVIAVNVGNEALVEWNDHMVTERAIIAYVKQVKSQIKQAVTVADNYVWWIKHGKALAGEVDFIGVHTYPQWENKTIDEAMAYTIQNIEDVHKALPDKPIVVLEGGWATTASEFGKRANEKDQARYYQDVAKWAKKTNTTFFFFEAFDEPWKGNPNDKNGAEKHWGLFFVNRTPKQVVKILK